MKLICEKQFAILTHIGQAVWDRNLPPCILICTAHFKILAVNAVRV